jgi:deoxyribodipyrimidine photo-lyase
MDVVWLKRDVRLRDHGPLAEIGRALNPFLVLYLYEPDQLSEPSVHGSHIHVINEGLIELDQQLFERRDETSFHALTVCHAEAVDTLDAIHRQQTIGRLLTHQETGHYKSFERDVSVRRWCKANRVECIEYQQSGVTRCLKHRADLPKLVNAFLGKPLHPTPNVHAVRSRLVNSLRLPGRCQGPVALDQLVEIPLEHRVDRPHRQRGGERRALETLDSFLNQRGGGYSAGISSPISSWTSCSRLSIYLAWGHISLRHVVRALKSRQEDLRVRHDRGEVIDGSWRMSMAAFSSRLVSGRSHCIQQLESAPMMEKRDLCPAYQPLRRQQGDWNEYYYQAWAKGITGFPFVDACMRCLHQHGWINFRMRAMLVSFATYNLWLDWKRIAPHLARLFLDFEPGIHYPQLQMQAGTTGINTMRVYNVTKQGKDQDPEGLFIKKYVPELREVSKDYIHQPGTMAMSMQRRLGIILEKDPPTIPAEGMSWYPLPIVDEKESATEAKDRVAVIRKKDGTRAMAHDVFKAHGSEGLRIGKKVTKALLSTRVSQVETDGKQQSIRSMLTKQTVSQGSNMNDQSRRGQQKPKRQTNGPMMTFIATNSTAKRPKSEINSSSSGLRTDWNCVVCTFLNENKPLAVACGMCGTIRNDSLDVNDYQ